MLRAPVSEFDLGSHRSQQVACRLNVAHLRNILENNRLVGEQSGSHAGKRSILRATYPYSAKQRLSATNDKLIHESVLKAIVAEEHSRWSCCRMHGRARTSGVLTSLERRRAHPVRGKDRSPPFIARCARNPGRMRPGLHNP